MRDLLDLMFCMAMAAPIAYNFGGRIAGLVCLGLNALIIVGILVAALVSKLVEMFD